MKRPIAIISVLLFSLTCLASGVDDVTISKVKIRQDGRIFLLGQGITHNCYTDDGGLKRIKISGNELIVNRWLTAIYNAINNNNGIIQIQYDNTEGNRNCNCEEVRVITD